MIQKILSLTLLSLLLCALSSCSSKELRKPKPEQIDAYIESHPDLPEYDKTIIYNGRPDIGIRDSTLIFLMGLPAKVEYFEEPRLKIRQEIWFYKSGWKFTIEDKGVAAIEQTEEPAGDSHDMKARTISPFFLKQHVDT
jgi:hypothetical protein